MTFVLPQQRSEDLLPTTAHEFQPAKIFEHRDRAATEDFDSFFRIRFVSVGQIGDRALRAIRETQRADDVVITVFAGISKAPGFDLNRGGTDEESQEVYKMADFADDAAAALFGIIQPVIGRDKAGVHAIMQRQRLMNPAKKALEPKGEWSEPAVETDHQEWLGRVSLGLRFLLAGKHDVAQAHLQ